MNYVKFLLLINTVSQKTETVTSVEAAHMDIERGRYSGSSPHDINTVITYL